MKVRILSLCVCTALLVSLSSSIVFADVSQVTDRDNLTLSETIYWDVQGTDQGLNPFLSVLYGSTSPSDPNVNIFPLNGTKLAVSHERDPELEIYEVPSTRFRDDSFVNGEYLLSTNAYTNGNNNSSNLTTFVFADSNVEPICGFGTKIAPSDPDRFSAQIEAFDGDGSMGLPFSVESPEGVHDGAALFLGLSSTTAISTVQIEVTNAGDGNGTTLSWYAINQVTLTYCKDLIEEPEVPTLNCEGGFKAPMAIHPVKAKKNRVFPLKMELFDDGVEQTDIELVDAPVVMVTPVSGTGEDGMDVNDGVLSAGHGSDGNQFDFTDDDIWQFNLKSKNYSDPGTYEVSAISGDLEKYVIDSSCKTSFIIR